MAAAFNSGLVLIELGLYEDASIVYERLLEHDPKKPEHVYEYAYCNHKRGQLWEAIRLYRMCLQLGCETPGVYAGLCSAFGEAKLFAEGVVAGLHGLHKYADVEAMYENLGEVSLDMGRLDDAEEVLTEGMGKFPESEAI
jgi:tetratricopeptide (TPR) repeat protein